MKKNYILMYGDCTKNINWFSDMKNLENFSFHYAKMKNYKPNLIWKIVRKIFSLIKLKNKEKFYEISDIDINPEEDYYILMVSDTLLIYDVDMINKINKYQNVHISLLLLNSIDASSISILKTKDKFKLIDFDFVLTFDYEDAKKYNFEYLGLTYYSKPKDILPSNKISDIFFVGAFKGNRKRKILNVYGELEKHNINANFNIMLKRSELKKNQEYFNKINYYKKWMPYDEVIAQTLSTNCIFEILQDNQNGQSLRYFEAICFNKKLLTNNKNVRNLPFYNEKYIKIFDKIDDIDFGWIKTKEKIDYGYKDEFSPIYLINKIDDLYNKKER